MSKIKINFLTILFGFAQIYAWATTYYLPAAIVKVVVNETGLSHLSIIGGFSWALLLGGLCAPKIGNWIDVEGGRRPLFCGSLFMGLGLIALSQTNGLWVWYLGWTLIGLGMALGLFNATFATVGRLLGQEAKKIIIRITLISGFATLFWPITTSFIQSFGWRETTLLFAIPHILIWAPLYYFSVPNSVPEKIDEPAPDLLVVPDKIKVVFYLLAVYATIRSMVGTVISVNIIGMLEGLGLTLSIAAMIAALIGPSQILGRILEMYFGKKFDPVNSSIFWTAVLPAAIFFINFIGAIFICSVCYCLWYEQWCFDYHYEYFAISFIWFQRLCWFAREISIACFYCASDFTFASGAYYKYLVFNGFIYSCRRIRCNFAYMFDLFIISVKAGKIICVKKMLIYNS